MEDLTPFELADMVTDFKKGDWARRRGLSPS
jgi:hypothetical protein